MKAITLNIADPVFQEYEAQSRRVNRQPAELFTEAGEQYRRNFAGPRTTLRDRRPARAGGMVAPLGTDDDLLEEMSDAARD